MFAKIAPYGKAVMGAVITGLGAARLALTDDIITKGESIDITVATLTALLVVWAIPNKDPEGEHQDESVQPADDGLSYEEAGGHPYPAMPPQVGLWDDQGYAGSGDPHRP